MSILLDDQPAAPELAAASTLGEALAWVQGRLRDSGKVIVKVELDGQPLDGPRLTEHHHAPLANRRLGISTADQGRLARTLLGKLAAMLEFLGGRHRAIAALIEKGDSPQALEQLAGVLSAWQQIHQSYTQLVQMQRIDLATLLVGERPALDLINDFQKQLQEVHTALTRRDMVLLADVLQYEFDAVVEQWTQLLVATLGVVGDGDTL